MKESTAERLERFVEDEWKDKRTRRSRPKEPYATSWDTRNAMDDHGFEIADTELTEREAARIGSAAVTWMEVAR